jgi:ketosteroid isomerase-like protein
VSSAGDLVREALRALDARDWDRLAPLLDDDVVHLTPGVPAPILGRSAFLNLSREAVSRAPDVSFKLDRVLEQGETVVVVGEWRYTGAEGPVRQPSVSLIEVRDGRICRDEEYFGLSIQLS